jgi:hypothetical protein
MNLTLFETLLLGHIIGDYFLQNNFLAFNKSLKGIKGNFICIIHCLIYTGVICLFTYCIKWQWIIGVFLSHYLIDKYSLANKYLSIIHGRTFQFFMKEHIPDGKFVLNGGFTAIVYTIVDNSFHLIIILIIWKLIN